MTDRAQAAPDPQPKDPRGVGQGTVSYLEGHRQRLRNRFLESGLAALEDHEVLELALTFAIPRRDVKPIAHALLRHFGSLAGVLDAHSDQLREVDGIGETAATLLHLVPPLTRRYLRDRWGRRPKLATLDELGAYVSDELADRTHEVFLLVGLAHDRQVIQAATLHEGTISSAPVYPRLVVEAALRMKAASVAFAHNHPGGVAKPSEDDIAITRTLVGVFHTLEIPVLDHVIVAGPRIFSFAQEGILKEMWP
jgi:DNA repair protein RadC